MFDHHTKIVHNYLKMDEQGQTQNYPHHRPRKLWWFGSFLLLIVLAEFAAAGLFLWISSKNNTAPVPALDKYQAVFLQNGQVYFGKLQVEGSWLTLREIYYLQVPSALQQGNASANQNFQLVKLGTELHGPEDSMHLPRENVNFWENLKDDSQAVRAIKTYQQQNP